MKLIDERVREFLVSAQEFQLAEDFREWCKNHQAEMVRRGRKIGDLGAENVRLKAEVDRLLSEIQGRCLAMKDECLRESILELVSKAEGREVQ
jgi:phage host-nuclease inhibitor protein Gam